MSLATARRTPRSPAQAHFRARSTPWMRTAPSRFHQGLAESPNGWLHQPALRLPQISQSCRYGEWYARHPPLERPASTRSDRPGLQKYVVLLARQAQRRAVTVLGRMEKPLLHGRRDRLEELPVRPLTDEDGWRRLRVSRNSRTSALPPACQWLAEVLVCRGSCPFCPYVRHPHRSGKAAYRYAAGLGFDAPRLSRPNLWEEC